MQTKDDLIRENTELRARLELAERWMQREVQTAMRHIQKKEVQSITRKHFSNLLEEEGRDIIARRIHDTFGDNLEHAPEYTLERLIDAEIYWQTLQKYPTMDGLPIVLAYQKILDAWVEKELIKDFRVRHREVWSGLVSDTRLLRPREWRGADGLAHDIENIITKKYTLSLGRLYQILDFVRNNSIPPLDKGFESALLAASYSEAGKGDLLSELVEFWKKEIPQVFVTLVSDGFFLPFSELMEREIFTKKRHDKKVTFGDAKKTKDVMNTLLKNLL